MLRQLLELLRQLLELLRQLFPQVSELELASLGASAALVVDGR